MLVVCVLDMKGDKYFVKLNNLVKFFLVYVGAEGGEEFDFEAVLSDIL